VALEVHSRASNVDSNNLLRKLQVSVSKCADQHVMVIVKNTHVLLVNQSRVGAAVRLCGVPESGDKVTQDVCSLSSVGDKVELSIQVKKLFKVLGTLHSLREIMERLDHLIGQMLS